MKLFISYSSKDRELVESLAEELDYLEHEVRFDRELNRSGGHPWWAEICEQIRMCEAFIYALSPHVLSSVPCEREYQYARDLGKPVLPLVLADLDYRYLPVDLQAVQILPFRARTLAEKKAIRDSLRNLPPCPPLPSNARDLEPDIPLDPVGVLIDRIRNLTPDPDQQRLLIGDIDDLRENAQYSARVLELLRLLLERDDVLTVRNLRRVQAMLGNSDTAPQLHFALPLLEWIDIPAGLVMIENPADTFILEPFKIAKYPVTNEQFQAFIEDGGYREDRYWRGLEERATAPYIPAWSDPDHPREMVNWYEAVAFTCWLSEKTGLYVTLPMEMHWQWAAIEDRRWKYPYGDIFDKTRCNTSESSIQRTTPVDRYPQGTSPFGVMDMSGNVWEWCLNEYSAPQNTSGSYRYRPRALRGGSWRHDSSIAGAVFRNFSAPGSRFEYVGFRVAVDVRFRAR